MRMSEKMRISEKNVLAIDIVLSAPPALEYVPEPRATGIHSLGP